MKIFCWELINYNLNKCQKLFSYRIIYAFILIFIETINSIAVCELTIVSCYWLIVGFELSKRLLSSGINKKGRGNNNSVCTCKFITGHTIVGKS